MCKAIFCNLARILLQIFLFIYGHIYFLSRPTGLDYDNRRFWITLIAIHVMQACSLMCNWIN